MENFVITKKFDNIGRVVIPKDIRKYYGFENNCIVQFVTQENGVLIVSNKKEENDHRKDNCVQRN